MVTKIKKTKMQSLTNTPVDVQKLVETQPVQPIATESALPSNLLSDCSDVELLRKTVAQLHQVLADLKLTDEIAVSHNDNWYRRKATTIVNARSNLMVKSVGGVLQMAVNGN